MVERAVKRGVEPDGSAQQTEVGRVRDTPEIDDGAVGKSRGRGVAVREGILGVEVNVSGEGKYTKAGEF